MFRCLFFSIVQHAAVCPILRFLLERVSKIGFVSGHDFSRADTGQRIRALAPEGLQLVSISHFQNKL
jgi:hypothetical protein